MAAEGNVPFSTLVLSASTALSSKSDSMIPVLAYFGTLLAAVVGCLLLVLPWRYVCCCGCPQRSSNCRSLPFVVCALTIIFSGTAWVLTWTPILHFIVDHYDMYEHLPYDEIPSFFITAYEEVVQHETGWFWSQQLLMWVLPACTLLPLQSRRLGLPHLTPLLVIGAGFLGAISLGFPCFFVAIWIVGRSDNGESHPSQAQVADADGKNSTASGQGQVDQRSLPNPSARTRLLVLATTAVATSNVLGLPATIHVSSAAFLFHLICLHAILVVPTLAVLIEGQSKASIRATSSWVPSMRTIYLIQAACCALSHAIAVYAALSSSTPNDEALTETIKNDESVASYSVSLRDFFLEGYVAVCSTTFPLCFTLAYCCDHVIGLVCDGECFDSVALVRPDDAIAVIFRHSNTTGALWMFLCGRPFHNLCQTSIFLDVVLATLVAGPLFVFSQRSTEAAAAYVTWMLLASPGCALAVYCAQSEPLTNAKFKKLE